MPAAVGLYADRPGKKARNAAGDSVPASEVYKKTKPGEIDPFEKAKQVLRPRSGPCAGGGTTIGVRFAAMFQTASGNSR